MNHIMVGVGIPGTNRITIPNSGGQCFFVSIGHALLTIDVQFVGSNGNDWFSGRESKRRLQVAKLQMLLAKHVRKEYSNEQFAAIFCNTTYRSREEYASRLEGGSQFSGRQHWGTLADLQIVAHWLQTSSNFQGNIYTYVKGSSSVTLVSATRIFPRQPLQQITDGDILLYNNGNLHWMSTKATTVHFPPTESQNSNQMSHPDIIELE